MDSIYRGEATWNENELISSIDEGTEPNVYPTKTNMTLESWKPVPNHEDEFDISDRGNVAAVTINPQTGERTRTIIELETNPCGYLFFMGRMSAQLRCIVYVHEEVAAAFLSPCNEVSIVHRDGDVSNNHVSNLAWNSGFEECDLYDCGCTDQELEEFGTRLKEMAYANDI